MKSIFSRHGIPETVRNDCGSQFSTTVETTREYTLFSKKYDFSVVTSSPKYSQSNEFIESMVKNFKKHFEKSVDEDPYLMMLVLRTTSLENGYSPAEHLMGPKLKNNLPMAKKSRMPKITEAEDIRRKELKYRVNEKKYYDKHNRVKDLQELEPGQVVWITDQRSFKRIKTKHAAPRSYLVETPRGIIRRNRFHLRPSSGQLEYGENDTTRELPDFPGDSSPVPFSDDMPGTPSLYRSSPTTPSTLVHRSLLNSFIEQGVVGQCDLQTDLIYNWGGARSKKFKKRSFHGNRHRNSVPKNNVSTASAKKLNTLESSDGLEYDFQELKGNRIIDIQTLLGVFSILSCPKCFATGLKLTEDSKEGLCSNFAIVCKCGLMAGFTSTPKENKKCSLNTLLVFGLRLMGRGFSAGMKLLCTLNLPYVCKKTFRTHELKLLEAMKYSCEENMKAASKEVQNL
ncbi:hypothetical protein AVEN_258835-1 [Araneus ventricosus]|uniref:Integrase catalytic domain-containing protein n=1 Tax=Araneus ventricosus TaxID=182803 RepID=A0A4Y2KMY0_ARAVE|nr:hypothetical protein AVEN_258835-1 [Araneus ventricosus]